MEVSGGFPVGIPIGTPREVLARRSYRRNSDRNSRSRDILFGDSRGISGTTPGGGILSEFYTPAVPFQIPLEIRSLATLTGFITIFFNIFFGNHSMIFLKDF